MDWKELQPVRFSRWISVGVSSSFSVPLDSPFSMIPLGDPLFARRKRRPQIFPWIWIFYSPVSSLREEGGWSDFSAIKSATATTVECRARSISILLTPTKLGARLWWDFSWAEFCLNSHLIPQVLALSSDLVWWNIQWIGSSQKIGTMEGASGKRVRR